MAGLTRPSIPMSSECSPPRLAAPPPTQGLPLVSWPGPGAPALASVKRETDGGSAGGPVCVPGSEVKLPVARVSQGPAAVRRQSSAAVQKGNH
jgi:hypothetical protein